jgi:transposase InsO family protein
LDGNELRDSEKGPNSTDHGTSRLDRKGQGPHDPEWPKYDAKEEPAPDAYDNSMAESFVSTLKRELIHRHWWPTRQIARSAIFEYIEGFYNTRRRHSALGHLSPSEYEEVSLRGGAVA